jgi:leucyl aminopeptidase (aminopeptidase T)
VAKKPSPYARLVRNVLRTTLRVKPKENVVVECWNHGLDIAQEFVYQIRKLGARPMWLFEDEATFWRSVATLPKTKLGQVGTHEWAALAKASAYVFVPGPADIRRARTLGFSRYLAATAYNARWYRAAAKARLRGARIGLGYVTKERAKSYGFSYDAWRRMVLAASNVDFPKIAERGRKLGKLLGGGGRVEITAPNGTDLAFDLADRDVFVGDGIVDKADLDREDNVADVPPGAGGCTFDERSAEGTVVFDRPVPYLGTWVTGLAWTLEDGRIVDYRVGKNRRFFEDALNRGKPNEQRLGDLSVGLNPKAQVGFLQDGIVAGVVYLGAGGNVHAGGKIKSDFHFGAMLSGATVEVEGTTVVRGGRLRL